MRISSNLAVGSPTIRVAAIVVATLLLALTVAGAGIAGSRLLAADGTIVVDQNGNGTVTTITEAVLMAEDGDAILVKPGTYRESITVSKDITLEGENRDDVIVEMVEGGPMYEDGSLFRRREPYGFLILDSAPQIRGFTVTGPDELSKAVIVRGGAPIVEDLATGLYVHIHGGSAATIRDSIIEANVFTLEASPVTIEDSTIGAMLVNSDAASDAEAIIRNNRTGAIDLVGPVLVEGNELSGDESGSGIDVQGGDGWVIASNTLTGKDGAILVNQLGSGTIEGNRLIDNNVGIELGNTDSVVRSNEITGGTDGIIIDRGAPTIEDNSVEGASRRGLTIRSSAATPTLSGNTLCGNGTNLSVPEDAAYDIDATNSICEDVPAVTGE